MFFKRPREGRAHAIDSSKRDFLKSTMNGTFPPPSSSADDPAREENDEGGGGGVQLPPRDPERIR